MTAQGAVCPECWGKPKQRGCPRCSSAAQGAGVEPVDLDVEWVEGLAAEALGGNVGWVRPGRVQRARLWEICQAIPKLARLIRALRSRVAELEREKAAWQPIETAPKDGTAVLLWGPRLLHDGSVIAATWIEHDITYWHVEDGKFGPYPVRGPAPTHWMPLPEKAKE